MEPLTQRHTGEPSLVSALGRAIEAGQRLVMDRIDLARLDVLRVIERTQQGGAFVVLGGMMALVGWMFIAGAAVLLLEPYVTLPLSAALVGIVSLATGATVVARGAHHALTSPRHNGTPPSNGRAPRRWGIADAS